MLDKNGFDLWADGYDKTQQCLIVADELRSAFLGFVFKQISYCAGILTLTR